MSCLSGGSAKLIYEEATAGAVLEREEIIASVGIDCTQVETSVLCASDGVLYSSEPEPIFITK